MVCTLQASDLMCLRPGTVVACECNVHFRILDTFPDKQTLEISELGEHGKGAVSSPRVRTAIGLCLPMRVVERCIFEDAK